jgi:hypothetical protein
VFARHERPDVLVSLGLAVTPGNLAVQDMVSLFVQGTTPWHATWYADYFGHSVLTTHFLGLPGWYYIATLLSLGLIVLAETLHRGAPLALDDENAPPMAP